VTSAESHSPGLQPVTAIRSPLSLYAPRGAASPAEANKGAQGASTEMSVSGAKSVRCWRKLVALTPFQQGGRRSISIAPPSGGMRDQQPRRRTPYVTDLNAWSRSTLQASFFPTTMHGPYGPRPNIIGLSLRNSPHHGYCRTGTIPDGLPWRALPSHSHAAISNNTQDMTRVLVLKLWACIRLNIRKRLSRPGPPTSGSKS
jgi:hypothetical protein